MLEQLESRRFLSAVLSGIDLTINGTAGDDDIQVTQGGTFLMVHENGLLTFSGHAQGQIFQIFIKTFGGNDRIRVDVDINTTAWTGAGDDFISGGAANDILYGGKGNDAILGNDGDDFLIGEAGHDVLRGGIGDDILDGVDGRRDKLLGGPGKDLARVDRRIDFGRDNESVLRIAASYVFAPNPSPPASDYTDHTTGIFIADKTGAVYDAMFGAGGFNALFKFQNFSGKQYVFTDNYSDTGESSSGDTGAAQP